MDNDDKTTLRMFRNWFAGILVIVLILAGAASFVSRAFDLYWFPWDVQMKTGMIRNSNSYITTQQTALRQFRTDYETASTDGQRHAIVLQMHETADLIPNQVQPDIEAWLNAH